MVNGSRYISGNKKDTPLYCWVENRLVLDVATNMDSGLKVMKLADYRNPN